MTAAQKLQRKKILNRYEKLDSENNREGLKAQANTAGKRKRK
jgi:hypothetical protein